MTKTHLMMLWLNKTEVNKIDKAIIRVPPFHGIQDSRCFRTSALPAFICYQDSMIRSRRTSAAVSCWWHQHYPVAIGAKRAFSYISTTRTRRIERVCSNRDGLVYQGLGEPEMARGGWPCLWRYITEEARITFSNRKAIHSYQVSSRQNEHAETVCQPAATVSCIT